ncbi:hypothetical protein NIASO_00320 [Niabella soli DSM 19437]|uniref:Uncharacterized protein n=1 Tax=Niabella soli DSM 19437 TaxID=929713 RepID=W0F6M1_9BACT|nr:hypothetical protein NIASO_00320 [Niabella soli DSM 19437]
MVASFFVFFLLFSVDKKVRKKSCSQKGKSCLGSFVLNTLCFARQERSFLLEKTIPGKNQRNKGTSK